ncbi:hypothetical protein B0H14DRAFT_2794773, partial [Mycena olivaceomarginata]
MTETLTVLSDIGQQVHACAKACAAEHQRSKTLAQELRENDSGADDHVSTMIADSDKIFAPTRISPVLAELPKPLSLSPLPFSSVESSSLVWLSGSAADENGHLMSIWADRISSPTVTRRLTVLGESRIQADIEQQFPGCAKTHGAEQQRSKTLAQQLLENDSDADDRIFTMIAEENLRTDVDDPRRRAPQTPLAIVPPPPFHHTRGAAPPRRPRVRTSLSRPSNPCPGWPSTRMESRGSRAANAPGRHARTLTRPRRRSSLTLAERRLSSPAASCWVGGPKRVVPCPEPWTTS